MTDNQKNKKKSSRVTSVIAILLAAVGAVISEAESCDCSSDFGSDDSPGSLLEDFDYDFNMDDFDFSIFDNDYELEYVTERINLRVNKASFDADTGIVTAVIENYGNSSEDGLPAIIMKESKDTEDYICCVYPDSYYADASDKLGYSLEYRTLLPPQTEVTLSYQLQSYELEYLKESLAKTDDIWVTFYKNTTEETYCLLEME